MKSTSLKSAVRVGLCGVVLLLSSCGESPCNRCRGATNDTKVSSQPFGRRLSAVNPQRAAEGEEASAQGRMLIGRGEDYQPIEADPGQLFKELEGSMAKRRAT